MCKVSSLPENNNNAVNRNKFPNHNLKPINNSNYNQNSNPNPIFIMYPNPDPNLSLILISA